MGNERKIVGIRPTGGDRTDVLVDGLVDASVAPIEAETGTVVGSPVSPSEPYPGRDSADVVADDTGLWIPDDLIEPGSGRPFPWVDLAFFAAIIGWGTFLAWSQSAAFTQLPAMNEWPMLAVAFSAPLALIATCIMLIDRGSERSQRRHLRLLATLRREQAQLTDRLVLIDGVWREGQNALGLRAKALQEEAERSTAQVNDAAHLLDDRMQRAAALSSTISQQGETAQRAMEALLVALPKIEEVAARATESMRESGQLAYQYGGQLEAQIAAVTHETGEAQRAVVAAQAEISGGIASFQDSVSAAEQQAVRVSDAVTTAIGSQRDAALAAVALLQTELGAAAQTGVSLRSTLDSARDSGAAASEALAQTAQAIDAQLREIEARFEERSRAMAERLAALDADMARLDLSGTRATNAAEQFAARADTVVVALAEIRTEVDVALPASMERLQSLVAANRSEIDQLPDAVSAGGAAAEAMLRQAKDFQQQLAAQVNLVTEVGERTQSALADHDRLLMTMRERADQLSERLRLISEDDVVRAEGAIGALDATAQRVVAASVEHVQQTLGAAIDSATGDVLRERLAQVVAASDQAVAAASAASDRLMRELITIADSSAALEARAQHVSGMVDAGDRQSLSRQLETLVEALQSTAVDLTRLVDADVADQAWESYLKGDRSIFARRTLRLLTSAEAKDLRARYEQDDELRLMVNRYVQDFETMLRLTMDRREGSAIAVTLLSSDIGKIYVALAQAIERLRG